MAEAIPFGKYTLLRKLAEGGMAEIYLALQVNPGGVGKLLVIKRIRPEHNQDRDFIQMFLDEARIAANLNHPNIAQIFDVGDVDSIHYIAMEYVHGEDLRALCRKLAKARRPLPLAHALSMLAGACAGLHYAHTKTDLRGEPLNIVHRDVSPQNLLISYDGYVKLVDFGIAKASGRSQETRAGVLKGKLSYMSPEQVRGDDLDARSDIFALGILLYELTTGRRLYKDDSDFRTMQKICEEPPQPPSEIIPGYPPALEEIVLKSLEKNPKDRYPSAQAMQSDIEAFARQEALDISSLALGNFMRDVFQDKLSEQARLEEEGRPLYQILADRHATESYIYDGSASMARGELDPAFAVIKKQKRRAWPYLASALLVGALVTGGVVGYPYLVPAAPKPAPPAVPSTVSISIDSDPPGAEVLEKRVSLGQTPLTFTAESGQTLYLRLKLDGYEDEVLSVEVNADTPQVFVLFDNPLKEEDPTSEPNSREVTANNTEAPPKNNVTRPPKNNTNKNTNKNTGKNTGGGDSGGKKFANPFENPDTP